MESTRWRVTKKKKQQKRPDHSPFECSSRVLENFGWYSGLQNTMSPQGTGYIRALDEWFFRVLTCFGLEVMFRFRAVLGCHWALVWFDC